jgi:hypothetical protein
LSDQVYGEIRSLGLVCGDAEQMKCVGVLGLCAQHSFV